MSSPVRLQRPSNLALDSGKPKSRVTFKEDSLSSQTRSTSTTSPSPRKFKYDTEFRAKRKRAHSCSFSWDHFSNKRRKAAGAIVLPTKFLLGGNITDPLNLEALDKGDTVKSTVETLGGGCRRGSTVRVIIPPNINDPLNLDACSEDGEEQLADAISRQRRRRKTKKRKRRNSEPGGVNFVSETEKRLCTSLDDTHTPKKEIELKSPTLPRTLKDVLTTSNATPLLSVADKAVASTPVDLKVTPTTPVVTSIITESAPPSNVKNELTPVNTSQDPPPSYATTATPRHPQLKRQKSKTEDKIVSPVIPQPGVERKRHFSHQRHPSADKASNPSQSRVNPPKHFHPKNVRFQYGNYNQYYGYRNAGHKSDSRLKFLEKEWFQGKEVLDIGCNIGHITLSIGRDFLPQRIVGIDIDKKLVNIAKKNIRHYVDGVREEEEFPSSMKLLYGPLRPPVNEAGQVMFPHNVKFYSTNYVLENDALLEIVRPEFDVILCLSVTKWIHLNWGDEGLKRFFRRMFKNLKPGGTLILEPQSWPSYTKKRKLTNEIFENYKAIKFFPNQFGEFLSNEVGFTFVQKKSVAHYSRGFERPIYIYRKPLTETSTVKDGIKSSEESSHQDENLCKPNLALTRSSPSALSVTVENVNKGNVHKPDPTVNTCTSIASDILELQSQIITESQPPKLLEQTVTDLTIVSSPELHVHKPKLLEDGITNLPLPQLPKISEDSQVDDTSEVVTVSPRTSDAKLSEDQTDQTEETLKCESENCTVKLTLVESDIKSNQR